MRQIVPALGTVAFVAVVSVGVRADVPQRKASITGIRELAAGKIERTVVDLSGNAEVRQGCLSRPDRLYFDFRNTRMPRPLRIARNAGMRQIRGIRVGRPRPEILRVVLDIRGPAEHAVYKVESPARVVIDILPGKRGDSFCRNGTRAWPVPEGSLPVVVIDPGHGGQDRGILGTGGGSEAELALDVSQRLAAMLRSRGDADVVLTRTRDQFVPLGQRIEAEKRAGADVFVSLHAQANHEPGECGPRTYSLALTTSRAALRLASRENATYDHTVFELPKLLVAIMQHPRIRESRQLQRSLSLALSGGKAGAAGPARAPLALLVGLDSPGVFVSLGCLNYPREARRLRSARTRAKLARELSAGISDFLGNQRMTELQESEIASQR
ncbi:MAG: N-acetylmuramoyl-L-alanine amidase [Actinomycetota bacterium]